MYAVPGQSTSDTGKHIVRFDKFDETNANYIFKMTQKEGVANGFYAQSVYTDYYLNTGNGDSWYGELTTISETADNAQLFRQYKPGLFWVADETDTNVSRVIRPAEQNSTVYGWTTISDNITEDKQWYNAWKLIPVAEDKVNEIVEAQKTADADKAEAIAQLTQFVTDNAAAIAEVTAEDAAITPSTKAEVQETVETITAAAARWSYDIITPAAEIRQMLEDAEDLLVKAQEELHPEPRYWQVAAEPSAPEAGKSYIIKNAYNDLSRKVSTVVKDVTQTMVSGSKTDSMKGFEENALQVSEATLAGAKRTNFYQGKDGTVYIQMFLPYDTQVNALNKTAEAYEISAEYLATQVKMKEAYEKYFSNNKN